MIDPIDFPELMQKLEEFSVDPRCAPQWVGDAHVTNELTNIEWHLRPATARSRPEAPVGPKPGAVPTDHGFRPDHRQCLKRRRDQPRQPNEQQAIDVAEYRSLRRFS